MIEVYDVRIKHDDQADVTVTRGFSINRIGAITSSKASKLRNREMLKKERFFSITRLAYGGEKINIAQ